MSEKENESKKRNSLFVSVLNARSLSVFVSVVNKEKHEVAHEPKENFCTWYEVNFRFNSFGKFLSLSPFLSELDTTTRK